MSGQIVVCPGCGLRYKRYVLFEREPQHGEACCQCGEQLGAWIGRLRFTFELESSGRVIPLKRGADWPAE